MKRSTFITWQCFFFFAELVDCELENQSETKDRIGDKCSPYGAMRNIWKARENTNKHEA